MITGINWTPARQATLTRNPLIKIKKARLPVQSNWKGRMSAIEGADRIPAQPDPRGTKHNGFDEVDWLFHLLPSSVMSDVHSLPSS